MGPKIWCDGWQRKYFGKWTEPLSHRTQNLRETSCLRTIHLISLQDGRTSVRRHETVRGVPSRQGAHARARSRVMNLNDQRPPTWAPKRKRGMASVPVLHKSRRPSCTRRPTSILSTSQPRDRMLHAYIVYRSAYMGQCKPAPAIGGWLTTPEQRRTSPHRRLHRNNTLLVKTSSTTPPPPVPLKDGTSQITERVRQAHSTHVEHMRAQQHHQQKTDKQWQHGTQVVAQIALDDRYVNKFASLNSTVIYLKRFYTQP
jgi:hypothetical protein